MILKEQLFQKSLLLNIKNSPKLYNYLIKSQEYEIVDNIFNSKLVKELNYQNYLPEYSFFFLIKLLSLLEKKEKETDLSIKWELDQEYRFFMYRFATNEKGLLKLLNENNSLVIENLKKVLNQDYFYYLNNQDNLLLTLYQRGFKENIKRNILCLNDEMLAILFQDIKRKEFLINAKFLYIKCDHFEYFLDLKMDLKYAIAYYMRHRLKVLDFDKLEIIINNNFKGILDEQTKKFLINLFGKVSPDIIAFSINLALKYPNDFLKKFNYLVNEYFYDSIKTLLFWERYPYLINELLKEKKDKSKVLEVYNYLSQNPAILNIKNWEEDLENLTIDTKSHTHQKYITSLSIQSSKQTVLFNNDREIIVIKENGEPVFLKVLEAHYKTLFEYYGYNSKERNYKPVLYHANKNGDLILVIENEAIMVWLPNLLTAQQKELLLNLNTLSLNKKFTEKSEFYPNIVSDTKEQYYYFNGNEPLSWNEYLIFIQHMPLLKPSIRKLK